MFHRLTSLLLVSLTCLPLLSAQTRTAAPRPTPGPTPQAVSVLAASAVPADSSLTVPAATVPGAGLPNFPRQPALKGVNADTIVTISFDAPPVIGQSGSFSIYNSADNSLVDSVNLADQPAPFSADQPPLKTAGSRLNIIGLAAANPANLPDQVRILNYLPVIINGSTASLIPHNNRLKPGQSYYVTVDAAVFPGASLAGQPFTGLAKGQLVFSVKTKTASGPNLVVDAAGTADFNSLQGAIDSLPAANQAPVTIWLKSGIYQEVLFLRDRHNVTIRGQSRNNSIIRYDNSDAFNPGEGDGTATAVFGPDLVPARGGRAIFLISQSDNLTLDNLTIDNTHTYASSQAETIHFAGPGHLVVKNCNLYSRLDTVRVNAYSWFYNCLIAGDNDFVWGNARTALFEKCELRCRLFGRGGYLIQARVPTDVAATDRGFVFLDCLLSGEAGTLNYFLAHSAGKPIYLDWALFARCRIDVHIRPIGWYESPKPQPLEPSALAGWREYRNTDVKGQPLDLSLRSGFSRQLTETEFNASFANRALILGSWNPVP